MSGIRIYFIKIEGVINSNEIDILDLGAIVPDWAKAHQGWTLLRKNVLCIFCQI